MDAQRSTGRNPRSYRRDDLSLAVARSLQRIERDLVKEFAGRVPALTVHGYFDEALAGMGTVQIPEYLPALVMREVRRRAARHRQD